MIIDSLDNASAYANAHPRFKQDSNSCSIRPRNSRDADDMTSTGTISTQ